MFTCNKNWFIILLDDGVFCWIYHETESKQITSKDIEENFIEMK